MLIIFNSEVVYKKLIYTFALLFKGVFIGYIFK
jgi:hypothetical protein